MIAGLTMMSDEMAMALTCLLCLGTGMMLGMIVSMMSRKEDKNED